MEQSTQHSLEEIVNVWHVGDVGPLKYTKQSTGHFIRNDVGHLKV